MPALDGSLENGGVKRTSSSDGTLTYETDRLTLSGTNHLELAKKKIPSRRVKVQFKVEQGRVRVFLRYALDVAVFCEAAAPATCSLEGVVWQSTGLKPAVLLQSLEGEAVVSGFSVRSR